jgi:dihydroorotase
MLPKGPLMLRIKNGCVVDPASGIEAAVDIWIEGERIARVAEPGSGDHGDGRAEDHADDRGVAHSGQKTARGGDGAEETLDATGLIVAPGFIDLHCHLREPGGESSETIESGTRAAARGGFTAVCPMPNTRPVNDNASVTRAILERAAAVASTHVWPIGAASIGSRGEGLAEIAAMQKAGVVAVSDDGKPIATAKLLRQVMEYCRALDLPVIDHCEDASLFAGSVMREGRQSVRLGLPGMPAATESIAVARDVQIAELTGCRLHVAHLSTRASLELVRAAKQRGLRVTCEVTPHHFTLSDEDVLYDTHFKMNPPLGSTEDRTALIAGLADGTVDAIATDHAPHEPASKQVEFDRAPFGVTGFETALGLAMELVHAGRLTLTRMVELFTSGPARVLGRTRRIAAGEPADLTLFSTDYAWTFRAEDSASKSRNTPFDNREFRGAPMATVVGGRIVYRREA